VANEKPTSIRPESYTRKKKDREAEKNWKLERERNQKRVRMKWAGRGETTLGTLFGVKITNL